MIGCIVQARMGSSRLPGKAMMKIDDKNRVIDYVIKQLKHCNLLDEIVIATTILKEDNFIENYITKKNVQCCRGSALDVLDRYYQCAKYFSFSTIVRITSDNPLIDPEIIDKIIGLIFTDGCRAPSPCSPKATLSETRPPASVSLSLSKSQ